jgi:putative ABC transport system permease protein
MNFFSTLESATRAILANKLRSALTALGVIIGVGSVIAMMGIGEGTKKKSLQELEITGASKITVVPNWRRGQTAGGNDQSALRLEDVERLRQIPSVKRITGVIGGRGGQTTFKYGAESMRVSINGAEPQIQLIDNATRMLAGTWYTEEDEALMSRKVVLGFAVYDRLFGNQNAIGSFVRINNQPFEVVGVIDYKGGSGFNNPDEQAYIPFNTARLRLLGTKDRVNAIAIQGMSAEYLTVTQADVEDVLYATRRSATGDELFRIFNQGEALQQIQTQNALLSALLAGIASVSLLVGGIGIMNIMMVSVTERTKEIGLRKAIGAKTGTILSQFLFESVLLCVFGGFLGMVLGIIATNIVSSILLVPPVINLSAVTMSFGFSVAVGLIFGMYPAIRASRLQPIEALRHD